MPRLCTNKPNSFCYICGTLTFTKQKRPITPLIRRAYNLYFGCKVGDQEKNWAPHVCCITCATTLRKWLNKEGRCMPFAVPMIWREPKDHVTDCYFCMVPPAAGMRQKTKHVIQYPNIASALRPVPHSDDLPVPQPPETFTLESDDDNNEEEEPGPSYESSDPDFTTEITEYDEPHLITQEELNDLVRDLQLPKTKAELLGSRLQQWKLLEKNVKVSVFRTRQSKLDVFFSMTGSLVFCNDVDGLMTAVDITHDPSEWRLFIDSSKSSLKAVLLHNGNTLPSIPLGHTVHKKESYENIKNLLNCIDYVKYKWKLCGDLKVVALLLGLQSGYTKFCCFICEWDSRARASHFKRKQWPIRQSLEPGQKNVENTPLVDPSNVLLPPLHIKLGLMKNFVKAMNQEEPGFQYLKSKFPKLSEAKIKEGVFVGPQIRKLFLDTNFEATLNGKEKIAWNAFREVSKNFLGNTKSENYEELVQNMLSAYQKLGCNMSLKIHFLHSHLDFFPENCGDVSDEHGERFHQDIASMEKRYQGKWNTAMLADYCWTLIRDAPNVIYKRKSKRKRDKE